MCLKVDNDKRKPACAKSRKFVYKVMNKDSNDIYSNLFPLAEHHVYKLGELAISNRSRKYASLINQNMSPFEGIVIYGFHVVHSKKDAKKIIRGIDHHIYKQAKLTGERYDAYIDQWEDHRMAIVKCSVSFDDHIADGTYEDDTVSVKSSVYDKLTPIEEIFVTDRKSISALEKLSEK